jgi:hypothetical protein
MVTGMAGKKRKLKARVDGVEEEGGEAAATVVDKGGDEPACDGEQKDGEELGHDGASVLGPDAGWADQRRGVDTELMRRATQPRRC